jgi:hypothetical protein
MSTYTVTEYNSVEVADAINKAFAEDASVTVNGHTLVSKWGRPVARSYQNGTVGIVVPARTKKGATNDVFFKVGRTVEVR